MDRTPQNDEPAGIECPRCSCRHCPAEPRPFRVTKIEQRRGRIRRRRQCRHCGKSFYTVEIIEPAESPGD